MEVTLTSTLHHSPLITPTNTLLQPFKHPTSINVFSSSSSTLSSLPHFPSLHFGPKTTTFPNWLISCTSRTSLPHNDDDEGDDDDNLVAVLLEVDGVLVDAYRTGNRHAFNVAFRKLGLDCANWTQPIYLDLLRKGAGDEERMLALYFNRKKALAEYMSSETVSLRPGVKKFIDDACDEEIRVVIFILATLSNFGEETARWLVKNSLYGQLVLGLDKFSGEEEEASKAGIMIVYHSPYDIMSENVCVCCLTVASERQKIADEVDIHTGIPESIRETVIALRAAAEKAEASVRRCVVVAGTQSAIAAAEIIGMPCVVLRNSMNSRAEFPASVSVMDGCGDVDLTVPKLRSTL